MVARDGAEGDLVAPSALVVCIAIGTHVCIICCALCQSRDGVWIITHKSGSRAIGVEVGVGRVNHLPLRGLTVFCPVEGSSVSGNALVDDSRVSRGKAAHGAFKVGHQVLVGPHGKAVRISGGDHSAIHRPVGESKFAVVGRSRQFASSTRKVSSCTSYRADARRRSGGSDVEDGQVRFLVEVHVS